MSAFWDAEAAVWVAESEDVPGLVTEAGTMEELVAKLKVLIPELLEANGVLPPRGQDLEFQLTATGPEAIHTLKLKAMEMRSRSPW